MLQTPSPTSNSHLPLQQDIGLRQILGLGCQPDEIVDIALQALQQAGVELIEWRAVLYRRMKVPICPRDYSYVVPDESLQEASDILSALGLLLTPPSKFHLSCNGDLCAKGRFHRITLTTLESSVQHLVLYPLSFSTLSRSELTLETPWHLWPSSRCSAILVPRASAVYASLIRMMLTYREQSSTRTNLESDLSELIGYNLYGLSGGYVDPYDDELWKELEIDRRIDDAAYLVRQWTWDQEWRGDEDWIGDALYAVVRGSDISNLPSVGA